MTDQSAEPTMEEILASIRRIISEDDAPAGQTAQTAAAEADEPEAEAEDDVLELTDPIDEPTTASASDAEDEPASAPAPVERSGDLDIFDNTAMAAAPVPAPTPSRRQPKAAQPAPSFMDDQEEGLVSEPAAASAASAFGQLSQRVTMPAQGEAQALDDVVRELLRPLLKDWLDRNLTEIVERAVEAEVERIARRSVR